MRTSNFIRGGLLVITLFLAALAPSASWAHGGASVEADKCRINVGPHLVHFTAYQPQIGGTTEYCNDIPEVGPVTIVFDYEGKALREMTVEFEITKEPAGTRVFYQPPTKNPKGTYNTQLNLTESGPYLAHVTLVNEGQKVDAHVPFRVGASASGISTTTFIVIAVILIAVGYILYLSNPAFQGIVDKLLKKKKAA
jgi:hypothetical protein